MQKQYVYPGLRFSIEWGHIWKLETDGAGLIGSHFHTKSYKTRTLANFLEIFQCYVSFCGC